MYWIPKEGERDEDNAGRSLSLTGNKTEAMKSPDGTIIAMVSKSTFDKCQMEGTCLLADGTLANLANSKDYFKVVDRKAMPMGEGSKQNPLRLFTSVASNDLPYGTTIVVSELKNRRLPNGKIHNGCVRVEDGGWSFGGRFCLVIKF
ncbi:hypothetical protein BC936DRAFT_149591 [Jimgerdemannia flammicorona]|uniref:Uncharacterized protein n=1 Tax=Jimgerdemannia flammicorona TaxID=994334 RepID=A0A433D0I3_9FUNG|nr:hypothetical protein BC936DRAFT_149591 [Jimgerdemannia flammicorona]